jgi:hypothetical protein
MAREFTVSTDPTVVGVSLDVYIRMVVREEIAAQLGRLLANVEIKKVEGINIDDIYRDDHWRKIDQSL